TVDVQRRLAGRVLGIARAGPVDGCRGGIQERDFPGLAVFEQLQRDAEVVVPHGASVPLRRVGAGAAVDHGLGAREFARQDTTAEFVLVLVIGDVQVEQVAELVAVGQVVDRQDVGDAARIQPADQVAADEAGGAGDHDHDINSSAVTMDVPSLPTTMPPARLAHVMASNQSRPAARATARVASTVSPAPETSKTSCAWASACRRPSAVYRVMPC